MSCFKKLGLAGLILMAVMAWAGVGAATATTLEIGTAKQNNAVTVKASLAAGSSTLFKSLWTGTINTCTGSEMTAKTEGTFTASVIGGKVSKLTFFNCTHTTKVLSPGNLSIAWTAGTNGSVSSSGAEITMFSTIWGVSLVCRTLAGTKIGTLTGSSSGHATLDINALLDCGIESEVAWTGTYSVTAPTGLGVVS